MEGQLQEKIRMLFHHTHHMAIPVYVAHTSSLCGERIAVLECFQPVLPLLVDLWDAQACGVQLWCLSASFLHVYSVYDARAHWVHWQLVRIHYSSPSGHIRYPLDGAAYIHCKLVCA